MHKNNSSPLIKAIMPNLVIFNGLKNAIKKIYKKYKKLIIKNCENGIKIQKFLKNNYEDWVLGFTWRLKIKRMYRPVKELIQNWMVLVLIIFFLKSKKLNE